MKTIRRYLSCLRPRKCAASAFRITAWAVAAGLFASASAAAAPLHVVTTIFPLTDWARVVGGDRVEVHQLLPPGVEAHGFAPRPSDLARIDRADLFIYLGPDMEPWAERLLRGLPQARRRDLEAAKGLIRIAEAEPHDDHHAEGEEQGHRACMDPHVWLDPVLARQIVAAIAEAMAAADPDGAEWYRGNAAAYDAQLAALHERIETTLRTARHRTLLYGGHFAFGYFARRYGLEHRSPYRGFAPNAAPTARAIAEMIRAMQETGLRVIFHEELIEPHVARIIAEQTGAQLVPLHGAHNLSRAEAERGNVTYLSIMEQNLERLKAGLDAK